MHTPVNKPRILVVEDEVIVARDIEQQLLELGYDPVGHATQGGQAITLAEELHPDLVLMDIHLVGTMDGIEAAHAIRNKLAIPVIFLTAFAADDILARAKLTEPFGYILKPFSERELHIVIEMALYKHESELRLRLSEANLAVTLDSIGDAVIATDTAGLITRMNPTAEQLTGWPLAEALGQPLTEVFRIVNAQTHLPSVNPVQLVMERGKIAGLANHTVLLARDGREYQIADSGAPIRDAAGQIIGVVLVFSDVTEKYRMEVALKQSEQHLRDIFDGLGPNMFVGLLTPDGAVLEVNRQALAVANLKLEDVLGKPVEETFWLSYSDEVKQQMRAAVERAAGGEASRFDLKIRGAENQFIAIDFSMQPFRDESGKVVFLVPSAIVITERKLAEEALRESEHRLHLALDAARMGIFEWDVRHDRITWTHWHENLMMGIKPAHSGNTYDAFAQRVFPQDLPGVNAKIAHCIAEREPFMHEFRVIWPDASEHWISIRGEFTFADDGQPLRLLGVVVEITASKQIAEKIRSQLDELMRWQQVTLGREGRVRELKAEINTLLAQRGEPVRYPSEGTTPGDP